MNIIVISGRLGKNPEAQVGPQGQLWCSVPVAEGGNEPNWFDVRAFGRTAELVQRYGRKGRKVAVQGRMVQDRRETSNGDRRPAWRLLATRVEFLDSSGIDSGDADGHIGEPD